MYQSYLKLKKKMAPKTETKIQSHELECKSSGSNKEPTSFYRSDCAGEWVEASRKSPLSFMF